MFQSNNGNKRTPQMPLAPSKNRQALSASLAKMTDEEARRRIKVGTKCIELQQMLETQGCYTCEEITTKVEAFRSLLLRQNQPSAFPLLPFVYQTLLQPAQLLLDQLKVPQVSAELLQRSGISKNDVYAVRSSNHKREKSTSSHCCKVRRNRHSRSHHRRSHRHRPRRRHSHSRSWSRSRSHSSRRTLNDRSPHGSETKVENSHNVSVSISPPKLPQENKLCFLQGKKNGIIIQEKSKTPPSNGIVVEKVEEIRVEKSQSDEVTSPKAKQKSKKKKSKKKKKKKKKKKNKAELNGENESQEKNSLNKKAKKQDKEKRQKARNQRQEPEMGSFVSEDTSNKIVIESIDDLPTIDSNNKIKPPAPKITLKFNKTISNNNLPNPLEVKKKPVVRTFKILKISTPSSNIGKQSRLKNASKWDDKVLRNPNAPKNLKFPKCLPPSAQPEVPINPPSNGEELNKKSQMSPQRESRRSRRSNSCSCRSSSGSSSRSRSYSSYTTWSRRSSSRSRSHSWSRSYSRSTSRSRSRSRSPPKRNASPSFMERRRITSARKRPIPYKRKNPFNCRSSRSSSYSHSSYSSRSWSTRSRSRSRTWSRSSYSTSRSRSRSSSRHTISTWSRSRSRSP